MVVTCAVKGCDGPFAADRNLGGVDYALCADHVMEIDAGEHYTVYEGEVLLREFALMTLLNVRRTVTRGNPFDQVVLELGRNGEVLETVAFQLPEGMDLKFGPRPDPA